MSDTVEMTVWVKRGPLMVRRDALDHDDPDHPYNFLQAQGLKPEEYGVENPSPSRPAPSNQES